MRKKPLKLEEGEWTSDMGPEISDAQKKLAAVIASGQVRAWGRKTPHALIELIPSDPFRIQGLPVIVGEHGDMRPLLPHKGYDGPRWSSIEFEVHEIKNAFPNPPSTSAKEWMLNKAKQLEDAGRIGKRDGMVSDCMTATGCTKREAEAAHKSLPEKFKKPQGRPRNKSG
jgi:hypothetical protein